MPKFFFFPDSYNELRKELNTHWNPKKTGKHPHHLLAVGLDWQNWRCGWAMAWDAEEFVQYMNSCLDGVLKISLATNDDELRIDHICKTFLRELRKRRGEPNP